MSAIALKETTNRLTKKARRQPKFDLGDASDRQALGILISQAAKATKVPREFVSLSSLIKEWETYRKNWWAANPGHDAGDKSVDWDVYERQSLEGVLIGLRATQVLFQGHQWVCEHCHHRNWVDMRELRPELTCSVCRTRTAAPVDIQWLFRPNEFLIDSLREHSVLSLVWVLTCLSARARRSLVTSGPTWFGITDNFDEPDFEADLMAIVDGRAVLCEVKSSWAGLRRSDIVKLVELALRLRPDFVLLAVMENDKKYQDELAEAAATLRAANIGFELLTPKDHALDDGPMFFIE